MRPPLVTVVTPSMNQGKFIAEALRSVQEQEYPNLEHLVMDGGSTDGTVDILRDFASRHSDRLSWTSEPDRGQTDALNKGFRKARGEILGWLNADDVYEPGAVCRAVSVFADFPGAAVIYGRARLIGAAGEDLGPYPVAAPFDWRLLANRCYICQPAAFIQRRALVDAGLLDERFNYCMDYELWVRLGKRYQFQFVEAELARSRMHLQNKTLSARRQMLAEAFRLLKQHYGYVPLSWCWMDMEFRCHGGDQFFKPPVFDAQVRRLGYLLFLWHNLGRPSFVLDTLREQWRAWRLHSV